MLLVGPFECLAHMGKNRPRCSVALFLDISLVCGKVSFHLCLNLQKWHDNAYTASLIESSLINVSASGNRSAKGNSSLKWEWINMRQVTHLSPSLCLNCMYVCMYDIVCMYACMHPRLTWDLFCRWDFGLSNASSQVVDMRTVSTLFLHEQRQQRAHGFQVSNNSRSLCRECRDGLRMD